MVTPRTMTNQIERTGRRFSEHVARNPKTGFMFTCPRCGWFATHLVTPYYESPWTEFGGICSQCCIEANLRFDREGWPADPLEPVPEVKVEGSEAKTALPGMEGLSLGKARRERATKERIR